MTQGAWSESDRCTCAGSVTSGAQATAGACLVHDRASRGVAGYPTRSAELVLLLVLWLAVVALVALVARG